MANKKSFLFKMVVTAMLTAMTVIFARLVPIINIATLRISFQFIPIAVLGMMCGPAWACAGAVIADLIGAFVFPIGAYFPGWTLSAALTGLVFGLFLYNKPVSGVKGWLTAIAPAFIVTMLINTTLGTFWLDLTIGKGFMADLPMRLLKNLIEFPVQVIVIRTFEKIVPLLTKQTRRI